MVSYNACHRAHCVNCSARSIRWNGYSDDCLFRDWKRLVCADCGSVYEIKKLASDQTMESYFNDYMMPGDLFNRYHAVQAELRQTVNAKQYVAILSTEIKTTTGGKEYNPVHVAQIKDVFPTLRRQAFCHDEYCSHEDVPTVHSHFTVHMNTIEVWFYAPVVDFDEKKIAKSVIDSY
jgi:hypothetical protein